MAVAGWRCRMPVPDDAGGRRCRMPGAGCRCRRLPVAGCRLRLPVSGGRWPVASAVAGCWLLEDKKCILWSAQDTTPFTEDFLSIINRKINGWVCDVCIYIYIYCIYIHIYIYIYIYIERERERDRLTWKRTKKHVTLPNHCQSLRTTLAKLLTVPSISKLSV